ncbi:MAG: DegT/DnrJ/EryC1/StrS family aminotransferase [Acidimicrobiales bacterium]
MSTITVPGADASGTDEEVAAVTAVLRSGQIANGPQARALESEFTALCDGATAIAVSSGTDALYVSGRALSIGPSDLVIIPGYTFAATANAFLSLGARVSPVDVDPTTFNIDPELLAGVLKERSDVRCVVVVDLYGNTAGTTEAISAAREAGVAVIEDACQAHGATDTAGVPIGTRGDFTAFSLYASKNVSAGEGGVITTPDPKLAHLARLLRNHGCDAQYQHEIVGLNHRLPEMEAALALCRTRHLAETNLLRRQNAALVSQWCLAEWPGAVVPTVLLETSHVFHQFTIVCPDATTRNATMEGLRARGVDARVYYPYTTADLPGVERADLPVSKSLTNLVLSLPVQPRLKPQQMESLHDAITAVSKEWH